MFQVLQFHYTTWPDFGVPSSPNAFLEFLRAVRQSGSLEETVGPAVVHCSAGIGRSGTFCLVDSCLILIEREGLNSVSVREVLLEMRKYRMGLIQTPDQLRFSYQAIIEGAKRSNDTNENGENLSSSSEIESAASDSEDDEPPPLPPPRNESLTKSIPNNENAEENGPEKPLPTIPTSESLDQFTEIDDPPSSPENNQSPENSPNSELRQRKREERRDKLTAQIKDMKRKQQAAEQWTQLKRSVCTPVLFFGAAAVAAGFITYYYFRS